MIFTIFHHDENIIKENFDFATLVRFIAANKLAHDVRSIDLKWIFFS